MSLRSDIFRHSAEVGYWLGEAHWGNGYASEALRALTRYAFEELGLRRLSAGVFGHNPASARVLEKVGYRLEGIERNGVIKEGMLVDQHLYAILRDDTPDPT